MSEVTTKLLDVRLAGVSTAAVPASNADIGRLRTAQKMLDALEGVKRLGDACDRLSQRMDAFEGSAKRRSGYIPGNDVEPQELAFR